MKRLHNNWPVCGACETELGTERDAFLCAKCLRELPATLRRRVMNAEEHEQREARGDALAHLGAAVEERRMNLPRRSSREAPTPPRCKCGSRSRVQQKNFVTGEWETLCNACGHAAPEPSRRTSFA